MPVSRRDLLGSSLLMGASSLFPVSRALAAQPADTGARRRGGTLVIGAGPEATSGLTSAVTSAGTAQLVSGKLFDGLLTYDEQFNPQPQLATHWEVSGDGLALTFHLRPGVQWHDGQPFTSRDVAFSLLEVWKKYHSRGRTTFANVVAVDTPDPLIATLRLSRPAPYLLSALMSSVEAQVVPYHVYAGRDVLSNPANNAPIGTGPFRFVKWERGDHVVLERNPHYWDPQRPYLDKLVLRFVGDPAAAVAALETGEVQITDSYAINPADIGRLSANRDIVTERYASTYIAGIAALEFNLDRPTFRDVRVREAFAHAIDRDFIVRNIWLGNADRTDAPIPPAFPAFFTTDVPTYPFDLAKTAALLDAAGLKPNAQGVRLSISIDPAPTGPLALIAQHLRSQLQKVGIGLQIRSSDFAEFVNRVYTRRDFDSIIYSANAGPDPAIGIQRFYWSRNFQPGVAFSNASDYRSAVADQLLETAQVETDARKRRALYDTLQRTVQTDLPRIPLISPHLVTLARRNVVGFKGNQGLYSNFSDVSLV